MSLRPMGRVCAPSASGGGCAGGGRPWEWYCAQGPPPWEPMALGNDIQSFSGRAYMQGRPFPQ